MDKIKDSQLQDEIKLKKIKISPNSKRRERRQASKLKRQERKYKELLSNKGIKVAATFKRQKIQAEKERFERNYSEIQTVKRMLQDVRRSDGQYLTNSEVNSVMNKAIRFLYDRGLIKSSFEYYEDFLEQHRQDLDVDELIGLVDEAAESEKRAHEEILSAVQDPNYGKQFVRRKRSNNGYITSF